MTKTKTAFFALLLGLASSTDVGARRAHARPDWIIDEPSEQHRMTDLSFGAIFDGGYGFGLTPGLQLAIPVLHDGLIAPINDSLSIEPGLFLSARFGRRHENYLWVVPEFGPRWNFHLTPNWDVFASLKVGWAIGDHGDFWLRVSPGMQWWFAHPWALRLETGGGARVGPSLFVGVSYQFL